MYNAESETVHCIGAAAENFLETRDRTALDMGGQSERLRGCLDLSELVWRLVFCCKLLSSEPSKTTLEN